LLDRVLRWLVDRRDSFQGLAHDVLGSRIHKSRLFRRENLRSWEPHCKQLWPPIARDACVIGVLVQKGGSRHYHDMFRGHSDNGGLPNLWCVELVAIRKQLGETELRTALYLAKGIPSNPDEALLWMAQVMGGLSDDREAHFARSRQRLVVFTDKKEAAKRARTETNEFWRGVVREVRVV